MKNFVRKTNDVGISIEYCWCSIFGEVCLWPPKTDYFDPPLEKLKYYTNLPFPREHPIIVLINPSFESNFPSVKTKEEYDDYNDKGTWFIKCGPCDWEAECYSECKKSNPTEQDMQQIINHILNLNYHIIKELNLNKK